MTINGIPAASDLDRIVIIFPENVIAGVHVGMGFKPARKLENYIPDKNKKKQTIKKSAQ